MYKNSWTQKQKKKQTTKSPHTSAHKRLGKLAVVADTVDIVAAGGIGNGAARARLFAILNASLFTKLFSNVMVLMAE